jgi:N-acyl-L-homoserine lactone synthetase
MKMSQENMIRIIDIQNEQWCEQMTRLVENDQYDDADALYLEYVVDGEEPEEFCWFMVEQE